MFVRKIAVLAAATLATVAVTASIAPTSASASVKGGTVTASEGRRVIRAADRQKCLTLKEVRHIVHGKGVKAAGDYVGTYQTWKGKGKIAFLDVTFRKGCADGAWLDYDNGKQLSWIDYSSPTFADM